jgi:RNA 2',3'-cyclic 3'-phosphodiesterase
MRLFLAIDLPENIKDQIHPLQDNPLKGAKWTTPDSWHITLHFIGEAEEAPIREALAKVKGEAFSLQLRGVGTFPPSGEPNVLWLGLDAPRALTSLHQNIGEALKPLGYVPESRPYNAHLTLARFKELKPSREDLENYLHQFSNFETERFAINSFTLYQSELLSTGAVYTVRESYKLN